MRNWGKYFRQEVAGGAHYTGQELYVSITASELDSKGLKGPQRMTGSSGLHI